MMLELGWDPAGLEDGVMVFDNASGITCKVDSAIDPDGDSIFFIVAMATERFVVESEAICYDWTLEDLKKTVEWMQQHPVFK